jgi:uncharacterized protein YggE
MIRSKAAFAVAACMAGVVSGSIAVAQADTGSTGASGASGASGTPATITVNGSGSVTIAANPSTAAAQTSYLSALGLALTDAHTHASALTAAVGDTLGVVENVTEESNDEGSLCSGLVYAEGAAGHATPVPAVSPGSKKKKSHSSKPKKAGIAYPAIARVADDTSTPTTCTIEADVTVTYAMAPA